MTSSADRNPGIAPPAGVSRRKFEFSRTCEATLGVAFCQMPLLFRAARGLQNMSTRKRPAPHLRFLSMRHQSSVSHTVTRVQCRQRVNGPRSIIHVVISFGCHHRTCDSNALVRHQLFFLKIKSLPSTRRILSPSRTHQAAASWKQIKEIHRK